MTIREFVQLEKSGAIFILIDASKRRYMRLHESVMEADRNVIDKYYGEWKMVGFQPVSKRKMALFACEEH